MTAETDAAAGTTAAQVNGKSGVKPEAPRAAAAAEPVTASAAASAEECEDCGEPGRAAAGLGLLICAVAGGLLYIGVDLLTGGALSRKLGGAREDGDG